MKNVRVNIPFPDNSNPAFMYDMDTSEIFDYCDYYMKIKYSVNATIGDVEYKKNPDGYLIFKAVVDDKTAMLIRLGN